MLWLDVVRETDGRKQGPSVDAPAPAPSWNLHRDSGGIVFRDLDEEEMRAKKTVSAFVGESALLRCQRPRVLPLTGVVG